MQTHDPWIVPGRAPEPGSATTSDDRTSSFTGAPSPLDVLVVVPNVPYPVVWGFAQRAFQLARTLAKHHRVTMFTYMQPDQLPDVEALAEYVHEVVAVVREDPGHLRRRVNQVAVLASRLPFHAQGLRSAQMQSALDQLLARRSFDLVQLESSQLGWLTFPPGLPVIVDEHNIESELLVRVAASEGSTVRRLYNRSESERYRRFERRVWRDSAGCSVTSGRDAEAINSRCPEVPTAVVPNGVDLDEFAPTGIPEVPNRLVFTGLLDYRPNLDGISWFLDEVLPRVLSTHAQTELIVLGAGEPQILRQLRRPGVEVTGRVPDLRPYLESAAVVVVPLRMGGGTRLKIVEALAMGKAIVSTFLGAEGVAVTSDQIVLADSAADFAGAVGELLDDPATRAALGRNARVLAEEKYSWSRSTQVLEDLHRRVLAAASATEGSPM